MTYRAVYTRDPDGRWNVEIPSVKGCYTYGRTIAQARERIREALSLYREDAETAIIEDEVKIPSRLKSELATVTRLRADVVAKEGAMVKRQYDLVAKFRGMQMGHRDIGDLMGLSHQRVHQLEHATGTHGKTRKTSAKTKR